MSEIVWRTVEAGQSRKPSRSFKILREELYACGFCRGTGTKSSRVFSDIKCSVCRGTGIVKVKPPAITCAFCKGKGEEKPRSNVTCGACRGKGYVSVKEPIGICPACGGRAKGTGGRIYCSACRGAGVVTVESEGDAISQGGGQLSPHNPAEWDMAIGWQQYSPSTGEQEALSISPSTGEQEAPSAGDGMMWRQYTPFGEEEQPRPARVNMAGISVMAKSMMLKEKAKALTASRRGRSLAPEQQKKQVGQIQRWEIYECGFCAGTGQSRLGGTTCPTCRGKGMVKLRPPVVKCAFCNGMGRTRSDPRTTCIACQGKGAHHIDEPIEKCPGCQGTGGRGGLHCTRCRGKGVITVKGREKEGIGMGGEKRWHV